jgi:hypothetical protein
MVGFLELPEHMVEAAWSSEELNCVIFDADIHQYTTYLLLDVFYNLYFHTLSKYPGPKYSLQLLSRTHIMFSKVPEYTSLLNCTKSSAL